MSTFQHIRLELRLGEEKFVLGEYVSLLTARGTQHTYAVKRLRPV